MAFTHYDPKLNLSDKFKEGTSAAWWLGTLGTWNALKRLATGNNSDAGLLAAHVQGDEYSVRRDSSLNDFASGRIKHGGNIKSARDGVNDLRGQVGLSSFADAPQTDIQAAELKRYWLANLPGIIGTDGSIITQMQGAGIGGVNQNLSDALYYRYINTIGVSKAWGQDPVESTTEQPLISDRADKPAEFLATASEEEAAESTAIAFLALPPWTILLDSVSVPLPSFAGVKWSAARRTSGAGSESLMSGQQYFPLPAMTVMYGYGTSDINEERVIGEVDIQPTQNTATIELPVSLSASAIEFASGDKLLIKIRKKDQQDWDDLLEEMNELATTKRQEMAEYIEANVEPHHYIDWGYSTDVWVSVLRRSYNLGAAHIWTQLPEGFTWERD